MKPELEKLCTDYTANREAVKKAFRWDNSALYAVCANIFCANGHMADADRLTECRAVIKKNTGAFSKFRSRKIRCLLSGMLALGENPESRMVQANDYYRLLKKQFKGTEYLVLTAFLLMDLADRNVTGEAVTRGRELYRRMNKKHRMLTDNTDSVFAMLLAFSDKTDDELLEETEDGYQLLKARFSNGSGSQTAAQVLSMAAGTAEDKIQRVIELYDALQETGVEYGHSAELAPLAALSLSDRPVTELVEEIREADEFLAEQNLYGKKKEDLAQRAMHAVMIVSDQYAGTSQVNITVMTNTLDMLIAQQQAKRISLAIHAVEFAAKFLSKSDTKAGTDDKTENGNANTDTAEKVEK